MKANPPPACPVYLAGSLAARYAQLAPELVKLGTLDALNVDIAGKYILAENEYLKVSALVQESVTRGDGDEAAKYILAENEYLKVSALVQESVTRGDGDEAAKWIGVQDKLTKQILTLGAELGITPSARRARGLPVK